MLRNSIKQIWNRQFWFHGDNFDFSNLLTKNFFTLLKIEWRTKSTPIKCQIWLCFQIFSATRVQYYQALNIVLPAPSFSQVVLDWQSTCQWKREKDRKEKTRRNKAWSRMGWRDISGYVRVMMRRENAWEWERKKGSVKPWIKKNVCVRKRDVARLESEGK